MADLSRLLRPQSVAYLGGAQISGPIRAARRAGYEGDLYVVNPIKDEIESITCIPSVAELPVVPDAAVVGLSAERSISAVAELSAAGCGGAVVMVSGFAELNTDEGRERQQRLIAAAGDMPLLGPNCMGLMNQFSGAFVWGDDNHCERQSGPAAAIISQSGALLIGMTGIEIAFPLGYAISIGNQSVTTTADLINAVLEDNRIKAIGLYLEGMNDGGTLGDACYSALEKGVPVVALKGGDQAVGAAVAMSHTASMVVERDLWNAFKTRYGISEVSSPKAMVETLKLLTVSGIAKGKRLSIISYSGGLNGLAATRCAKTGIDLPVPTTENHQWLREKLPETVAIANPLDLNIPYVTSDGSISMEDTNSIAQSIIRFAEGVSDQIVFFNDVPRPGAGTLDQIWCKSMEALIEVRKELDIPVSVAGILPGGLPHDFCHHMQRNGVACLQGFSETMEAINLGNELQQNLQSVARPDSLLSGSELSNVTLLDEAVSKQSLIKFGLKTPAFLAVPVSDALKAAGELGYPVVLKVLSHDIAHKANVGGVTLGIDSDEALEIAVTEMQASITSHGYQCTDVLIEKMVGDVSAEVIIGIKRHAALGLALMVGKGGSQAEETAEFETLLLPCSSSELKSSLAKLGLHNHAATAELMGSCKAVADYAIAHQETLESLDVNPVMLTTDGQALATDALIEQAQ